VELKSTQGFVFKEATVMKLKVGGGKLGKTF